LAVKADEQIAVSEDGAVRLFEPGRHPDPVDVERLHRVEPRGSAKDDPSCHGRIVLDPGRGMRKL